MKKKKTESEIIQTSVDLNMHELTACILGTTPFICNSRQGEARQGRRGGARRGQEWLGEAS